MSAVSRELSDARLMVANCLKVFHNVDIAYQPEFGTESGQLLSMLERRVNKSVGVLQLVGEAYGAAPQDKHAEFGTISFTQFELLYALKRKKLTWLIQVKGSCTREVSAPEFVVSEASDVSLEAARLRDAYHRRLRTCGSGGLMTARPADGDELKAVIAEHNRRRQLQHDYFARQHAHLYSTADNDDEIVERVRHLQGLPRVRSPKGFNKAGLEDALAEGIVGRGPLMFDVLVLLRRPGTSKARIVLRGLGGTGKTRVAIEIGHAYHKIGHHVLMCKAVPGRPLDDVLGSLGKELGPPRRSKATDVRAWLRKHEDWLMIVDGVDDVETAEFVEEFCKEYPEGWFLITSYLHEHWSRRKQFKTREVDELQPADAHRLLRRMLAGGSRPPDPETDTLTLTRQLGGLPLAIEYANGYLNTKIGELVGTYVAKLERTYVLPEMAPSKSSKPLRPIGATWQTSLDQVQPSSRTLLRLLSFLTDDPIPAALIASPEVAAVFARACAADPLEQRIGADHALPEASDAAGWQDEIWRAIHELLGYCLLRWHDRGRTEIRAHRLVLVMTQASLRTVATDVLPAGLELQYAMASLHGRFLGHAIRFLTDYLAREGRAGRKQIYPHLVHLAKLHLVREADEQLKRVPLLLAPDELIFLGDIFSLMGEGREAEAVSHFARALAAPTATAYERARANQGLGWACFQEGSHGDALKYYAGAEAAIDGQPDNQRNDDLRYEIHSGRGWVNRFVGNLDEAIPQLKRAMSLAEGGAYDEASDRGDTIARLADAYICLGGAFDYAGDYDAARTCYAEALEGADESGDHNLRGLARYMGGWFLIRQGPVDQGMTLCEQALKLGEEFGFGDIRGEAAWILAIGHARNGRFQTALAMADRAARRPGGFVAAWVRMIRGIMRFRAGLRTAATDFERAIKSCDEDIAKFVNFDPLDTRAFAHAGLAVLGREEHEELAVRDYRRARELASAPGIVDIGKTVFSCFGSTPPVKRIEALLFGDA